MKSKITLFTFLGIIFTVFLGSALHFTFVFSGRNQLVALFSAVNESTWEHMKLSAFPIFVFSFIEYFSFGRKLKNFWTIKAIELYLSIILMIFIFYSYTAILGRNFLVMDIGLFVVSVIIAKLLGAYLLINKKFSGNEKVAKILILLLILAFFVFTFIPPKIFLFRDPRSNSFGI